MHLLFCAILRPYFDVDTSDVAWRCGNTLLGPLRSNFLDTTHDQPDLYGPFWIATTLIFVTAVAGNYADYWAYASKAKSAAAAAGGGGLPRTCSNMFAAF